MNKINVLGIQINNQSKAVIIKELEQRIESGSKTFIVTPYSEFIHRTFLDYDFKQLLNSADFALPDGVAIQWLSYFLNIPYFFKNFYLKIFETYWQVLYSCAAIIFYPNKLKKIFPERISGVDFFWDLLELAEKKNLSIFLLGGYGNTPDLIASKIKERYPNVKIAGFSNKGPGNQDIVSEINISKADMLFVAYGPVKQETWIRTHLSKLDINLAIGLGGTFDYISGKVLRAPHFLRSVGLEWLFRLIMQPRRFKRIWNGTVRLIMGAFRYKVFMSMPYRQNVASVILNKENMVFVAKRGREAEKYGSVTEDHWQFPQGGVDENEDLEKAVLREVREETNISALSILGKSEKTHSYLWNSTIRTLWFNRLKFKGQEQTIFYLKYQGNSSEIKLDGEELTEYKWVKPSEVKNIIHSVRSGMVDIVLEDLKKYI
ncbi:MAG: WecB/TagA/CpsF family glycosyltransferase [Candidatus Doudnabacteria bacterium]